MVIMMLTRRERGVDELSENFQKETENIKSNQSVLRSTITKMKNIPKGINRLEDAGLISYVIRSSRKHPS